MMNFKKWQVLESLGDGTETFTQGLAMHNEPRNLDITPPLGWEIDTATGEIVWSVEMDVRNSGIRDIVFSIVQIKLSIDRIVYKDDNDDEGETVTEEIFFDKNTIGTDPKVEIHEIPFYLSNIEIDFSNSQNLDGEIDLKKVKFELEIGEHRQ